MKRTLILLLMSTLMIPFLFASGQEEAAADTAGSTTTLNIWTWYPREQVWNEISEEFERQNPDISLDVTIIESLKYQEKLPIALATGEDLDLVGVQATSMVNRIKDYLAPMDEMMAQYVGADWEDQFVKNYIDNDAKISDRLYFLSTGASGSMVCYYNAAIFEELGLDVPRDYDDLKEVVSVLNRERPDVLPVSFAGKDAWVQDEILMTILCQKKPFFNEVRYNDGRWDDKDYVEALALYKGLFDDGIFSMDVMDLDYSRAMEAFYTGKAAIFIQGAWECGSLSEPWRNTNGVELEEVGAFGFPVLYQGGTPSVRSFGDAGIGVIDYSSRKDQTMELVKFLMLGDGVDILARNFVIFPAKKGYTMNPELLTSQTARDGYSEIKSLLENPTSDRYNMSAFSNIVGQTIQRVILGEEPGAAAAYLQKEFESGRYTE